MSYFTILFWMVLGTVVGFVLLLFLALRSGHGYSVHDTEAHATEYAEVIKEGHGGMTAFMWVTYAAMLVWIVYYMIQHWHEFSRMMGR